MMQSDDITDEFFEESTKRFLKKPAKDSRSLNSKESYDRFEPNLLHDLHDYFHRIEDDWKDDRREEEISRLGLPRTPKFNVSRKGSDNVLLETLLESPARDSRPARVLILIRGAPGSGKTFLAKKIIKREEEMGGTRCKLISCNRYYAKRYNDEDVKAYKDYLYDELKEISEEGFYNFVVVEVEGGEISYYCKLTDIASSVGGFEFYTINIHQKTEVCIKFCRHKRNNRTIENICKEIKKNLTPYSHKIIDPMYMVEVNPNDKKEEKEYPRNYSFGGRRNSSDSEEEEAFMTCIG